MGARYMGGILGFIIYWQYVIRCVDDAICDYGRESKEAEFCDLPPRPFKYATNGAAIVGLDTRRLVPLLEERFRVLGCAVSEPRNYYCLYSEWWYHLLVVQFDTFDSFHEHQEFAPQKVIFLVQEPAIGLQEVAERENKEQIMDWILKWAEEIGAPP